MNRISNITKLKSEKNWDFLIIGGGSSGLGCALDASSRGYKTLLVEKYDFAKGTSSRSTKLVHGGVRYLQNGDISLVIEALKERGIMRKNAPHLVKDLSFVIPSYDWWNSPFYGIGLKIYDMMAGDLGIGPSTILNEDETIKLIPNVKQDGLRGGVIYHDGQFDDSRMAISIAKTANNFGGTLLNYIEMISLNKNSNGAIVGATLKDSFTNEIIDIKSKVVINATGVFADSIMRLDQPKKAKMIMPSQGVHIVLDKSFLDGPHAIMVPQTTDGRVLFAVPWHNHVVVGTTDTLIKNIEIEPKALNKEIDFILSNASRYMIKKPNKKDIKSVFVGLRPLANNKDKNQPTKEVSRHHKIIVSTSGLVTILGGKWTTYRKIAEDAINTSIPVGGLKYYKCISENIRIHGYQEKVDWKNPMHIYGSESKEIMNITNDPRGNISLSKSFHITKNQIIWSIRNEMALTLEDVLARRTRCLFLDSRETEKIIEPVIDIMCEELQKNNNWKIQQKNTFLSLIKNYRI